MPGIEIAVGYLFAWAVHKARRVGKRADGEVDRALDAGMDRLHELVSRRLGEETALGKLEEEAKAGREQPSESTGAQVRLALEETAERDSGFAEALGRLIHELETSARSMTNGSVNNAISGGTFSGAVLQGRDFSGFSFSTPRSSAVADRGNADSCRQQRDIQTGLTCD